MLDIKLFREKLKAIEASEKKRGRPLDSVENVIKYDSLWRKALQKVEKLKHQRNIVSEEINQLKKQNKPAKSKISEMRKVVGDIKDLTSKSVSYFRKRENFRSQVGNILDKEVPKGLTENDNKVLRKTGSPTKLKNAKAHTELLQNLDLLGSESAAKVAGAGFFYLKNELAVLDRAISQFAIDFLMKKGFQFILPPYMLNREALKGGVDIDEFKNTIYKIDNENLYLIGTAEHPLLAMHAGKTFDEKELPLLLCGYSTNFRKEGGAHGKYTKGLFRTHQFNKVEQFIFCKPEDSEKYFRLLQKNAEELYKKLKIPFRVAVACSGDTPSKVSKLYDVESYMADGQYREIGSCSNCTDYQAETLNIKFKSSTSKGYLHTLNSTALATSRTIIAIVENHQQKDGSIKIPSCLWKYTGFKKIAPNKA